MDRTGNNRRRKYMVNKGLQLKIIALETIPLVLCLAGLYYILYYFMMNEIMIPEAIAGVMVPALKKANFLLVFALPLALFVIIRAALIYSNKVAGPMYRFEHDMDEMIETERIIGDIAFTAIRGDGEPVPLRRRRRSEADKSNTAAESSQSDEDTQYVIYSAVTLPVLAAMAKDSNKSVILVARYEEGKYKVPAIFASVAGERHRYASRLIIDEETARRLLHY